MSLSKEEMARFQGAAWALRMVEEKGLEATQKDLEQRGIRRLPLACKKQDIREFEQYEKKNTLATVLMMTCVTLRDEYGFGFDRMNRFIRRFNTKTECLVEDYVNWKPILGTMASESKLRETQWLKGGCNAFNVKRPTSSPMSFWTEQDVLQYIFENKLKLCSVYGDVVEDFGDELEGQMSFEDVGLYDKQKKLKCSGYDRTGCVLCGFGAHLEKENESRFLKLKESHPKFYALLDVFKNNGVTYRGAIEWTNEHGGLNIRL